MVLKNCSEEHGGINPTELRQYGISPDKIIDFSVNSNPFGPSPKVLSSIIRLDISKYPDRFCADLKYRLAELNHISPDKILVGNGTAELIFLSAQAFLTPGDNVLILGPTFGEYARAATAYGANIIEIQAETPEFHPPVEQFIEEIQRVKPALVFVCNPNNPTGQLISQKNIARIANACKAPTILVLDEAYRSFAGHGFFGGNDHENCVILRSMTKDFALAGLRLGYLIAPHDLATKMRTFQPSWSVNALAQAAGLAALNELPYYENTLSKISELKIDFFTQIESITGVSFQTSTHFGLIHTPVSAQHARDWFMRRSIQVRDCTSFGLPEQIRVSTQMPEANQDFLFALQQFFEAKF